MNMRVFSLCFVTMGIILSATMSQGVETRPIAPWVKNLLLDTHVSGNLESYGKDVRGTPDTLVYDIQNKSFRIASTWHEYGVVAGQDIGIVTEANPAWWMAEWKSSVEANFIALSGVYPNQPQPNTAWKIELRQDGQWRVHANGVGDWYDRGHYRWGGAQHEATRFDAIRVSLFSKDDQTPLKSIHFRGEENRSWIVAFVPPLDVRWHLSSHALRLGEPLRCETETILGKVGSKVPWVKTQGYHMPSLRDSGLD
jgi:hypothetical protein